MLKKISAVVATLSMMLVGLSVSPASATSYAANADSTANREVVASTQLPNGDFSVPLPNLTSIRLVKSWTWKGTKVADVLNKRLKVNVSLTRPNGAAVNNIASSSAFQYYMYSTLFQGFGQESVTLPVGTTETTITPGNNNTYDRYTADLYMSVNAEVASALATGTYRITYEVLLDGAAITNFGTSDVANTNFSLPASVNFEQPRAVSINQDVQFGTYKSVQISTQTCLKVSAVTSGDQITARRVVDGVVQTTSPYNYVSAYVQQRNVNTPNNVLTVDYSAMAQGAYFYADSVYYNPANIGDGTATANNTISQGSHTFEISLTKADGTEVSGPCLAPAPNQPSAGVNGDAVAVNLWGPYNYPYLLGCQLFLASDNSPVGNPGLVSTEIPMSGYYTSITCQPTGYPRGVSLYAKLYAYSPGLSAWKSYSPASSNFTAPLNGVTLSTTPSNGTAFGQIKTPVLVDELSLGSNSHNIFRASEPTGGFYESVRMGDSGSGKTLIKLRRLTAAGVDSNFNNTTFEYPDAAAALTIAWHGTLVSPKPVVAIMNRQNFTTLQVRDFTTAGAAGDSRTFTNAELDTLCASSGAFGSGYIFNKSNSAKVYATATSDVYMQISCQTPFDMMSSSTNYGYLLLKINLANSATPTIVTVLGNPTTEFPMFATGGSMAGPTGIPAAANAAATGATPMLTFVAMPTKQESMTYTYSQPKLIRVAANGTVTSVNAGLTLPSGTSSQYSLNLFEDDYGTIFLNTYTMSMNGSGAPVSEYYIAGPTGAFARLNLNLDSASGFNSDSGIYRVIGKTTDGQLLTLRRGGSYDPQTSSMMATVAMMKINLTNGNTTTFGEALSYSQSNMYTMVDVLPLAGNGVLFVSQDETNQGKILIVRFNGGELPTNGGGNNGGGGSVTAPDPTGDGTTELGKSINGGGSTFTLTGTGLNVVTEVWIGGVKATIKTKASGSITVVVPRGTSATAPVVFKYTGGEVTAGVWNYVGAAKVSQTLTFNAGGALANYADPDRTLTATSANSATQAAISVPITFVSSTTKVCTIVNGNKLHFVASGVCTVKATQPGSAWLNKATDVSSTVTVIKATQSWSTTPATTLAVTDVTPGRIEAVLNNSESVIDFTSQTPLVCEVDGAGNVTGLIAGTCTVLVSQVGDARYSAVAPVTVTVTVTADTNPIDDFATTEADSEAAKPIPSSPAGTFIATNDPSFQLSWNSATGKLIPRAGGIYIGHINAKVEFTRNNVNYVCQMSFGNLAKMPVKTSAQKKAAKAMKVFSTKTAFCYDAKKLSVPVSLDGKANFAKLKPVSKTTAEKNAEKLAANALKGFTGNVTITVTRYRTWWSTMLNVTGDKGNGKKIKATKRVTSVVLG